MTAHADSTWRRLTREAGGVMLYWSAMLAGYSAGIALILRRIGVTERLYYETQAAPGATEPPRMLLAMEPFWIDLQIGRYADAAYLLSEPESWLLPAVAMLLCVAVGRWVGRLAPLKLAPGGLALAVEPARREVVRAWRRALRGADPPWHWPIAAGALAGFLGAIAGEMHALVVLAVRLKADVAAGGPGMVTGPRALLGVVGAMDGALLVAVSILLPAATTVVLARRALRQEPQVGDRYCLSCGYPRSAASGSDAPTAQTCPECGAASRLVEGSRMLWPWLLLSLCSVLLLALAAHRYAPLALQKITGF